MVRMRFTVILPGDVYKLKKFLQDIELYCFKID